MITPTTLHPPPTLPSLTASHTSINITTLKILRIERDYSKGDGITQFCTDYPNALQGKITLAQYEHTINTINTLLLHAERLSWLGALYNLLEILTLYLLPLCVSSHYQKTIHRLLAFINKENRQVYQDHRLLIGNPVKTAFLYIEIQIFD
ncbi:Golgin subfamily A member 7/ERF4 family-domain-containing protein [Chlamydoabsidia padenii]|nr:Golgin subfamily A member 7/ERF4 family-domain-containing protein [Chlamydoabsidia padenii]